MTAGFCVTTCAPQTRTSPPARCITDCLCEQLPRQDRASAGTNLKMSTEVVQQASTDRIMRPIPADFLRLPQARPSNVALVVNGITAICRGGEPACAFRNDADAGAESAVSSMQPASGSAVEAGATLTFSGTGLAAAGGVTEVLIGQTACRDVVETGTGEDTQVQLSLPHIFASSTCKKGACIMQSYQASIMASPVVARIEVLEQRLS